MSSSTATAVQNPAFTRHIMQTWRAHLGVRGTLMNHGLVVPQRPPAAEVYTAMRELGGNIQLQMSSPITDYWPDAVSEAEKLGATAVELWPPFKSFFQGFDGFPADQLAQWGSRLKRE